MSIPAVTSIPYAPVFEENIAGSIVTSFFRTRDGTVEYMLSTTVFYPADHLVDNYKAALIPDETHEQIIATAITHANCIGGGISCKAVANIKKIKGLDRVNCFGSSCFIPGKTVDPSQIRVMGAMLIATELGIVADYCSETDFFYEEAV